LQFVLILSELFFCSDQNNTLNSTWRGDKPNLTRQITSKNG
jgi:hypothetical protein